MKRKKRKKKKKLKKNLFFNLKKHLPSHTHFPQLRTMSFCPSLTNFIEWLLLVNEIVAHHWIPLCSSRQLLPFEGSSCVKKSMNSFPCCQFQFITFEIAKRRRRTPTYHLNRRIIYHSKRTKREAQTTQRSLHVLSQFTRNVSDFYSPPPRITKSKKLRLGIYHLNYSPPSRTTPFIRWRKEAIWIRLHQLYSSYYAMVITPLWELLRRRWRKRKKKKNV